VSERQSRRLAAAPRDLTALPQGTGVPPNLTAPASRTVLTPESGASSDPAALPQGTGVSPNLTAPASQTVLTPESGASSDPAAPPPESAVLSRESALPLESAVPSDLTTSPNRTAPRQESAVPRRLAVLLRETPDVTELPSFEALGLLRRQLAETGEPVELSAAEIAALPLAGDEPPPDLDEVPWWLSEEFTGSDEELAAAFVQSLPADIRAEYAAGPWTGAGEAWGAGFLHHDPGAGPRGDGFAAGGEHDVLAPGPELAAVAAAADDHRGRLGESELIGVLCGWQRLAAWAQSRQAACLNELVQRRKAQSVELNRPSLAEHVDDEVAAALALTGRAAVRLLSLSGGLARLPEVLAALNTGRIDWVKAGLFVDYLAGLPDEDAADIAGAVLADADRKTSGQLRAMLMRAVLAYDPDAAQRRRRAARKDASVQAWDEVSGNAALAGRELAPEDVAHASARITEYARWLHEHGAEGTIDQLRADAFVALLTGRPVPLPVAPEDERGAGLPTGWPQLSGSITLTMPMSAWLGQSAAPGELAGYGPAAADTCRELAGRAGPGTRWCLTLTDHGGRAVAHACASGPPGVRWAAGLRSRLEFLETGTCSHARCSSRYRPPRNLVHLIGVRQRTCSFPGCRRPARRCDLDHTVPYDQGGATCECNLSPLCRRHHQAKQAHGWRLTQDQPGVMTWRTPSGRIYATCGEPYPV